MKENQTSCVDSPLEVDSGIPQCPKTYAFIGFDFSPGRGSQGLDIRVVSLLLELK